MKGWEPKGKYALQRGRWTIAKAFIMGATIYSLFDTDGTCFGRFESAQEAADFAEGMGE